MTLEPTVLYIPIHSFLYAALQWVLRTIAQLLFGGAYVALPVALLSDVEFVHIERGGFAKEARQSAVNAAHQL